MSQIPTTSIPSDSIGPRSTSSPEEALTNEDILTEILLRLPTKSLLRLKTVSKRWCFLISGSQFRRLHSRRNFAASTGLFLYLDRLVYLSTAWTHSGNNTAVPFNVHRLVDGFSDIFCMHCCNGLLCVGFALSDGRDLYYMYNPSTHEYASVPPPKTPSNPAHVSAMNLVFDPLRSDEYKIVCVWNTLLKCQFRIYSSATGVWKDSGVSLEFEDYHYDGGQYFFNNGAVWNGNVHWVSDLGPFLRFDVDRECLRVMPSTAVPEGWWQRNIAYFGVSGGSLLLIEIYGPRATVFNVLSLERDYSTWVVKHRIDIEYLTGVFPQMVNHRLGTSDVRRYEFDVLSYSSTEGKTSLVLLIQGRKVIMFTPDEQAINELLDVTPSDPYLRMAGLSRPKWYHAYQHIESLVCV